MAKLTHEQIHLATEAVARLGSQKVAAAALGVSRDHIYRCVQAAKNVPDFVHEKIPSEHRPVEDLIAERKAKYAQKAAFEEASKLVPVKVNLAGPIGILHFGDPHVDDDGTDIAALERHTDLVRETKGLFGANIGDTTNNWVGRLARLYGEQSTSSSEAWQLAEWFIGRCDWLYLVGGNHDQWSGSGDPLNWIKREGSALYQPSQARIRLDFPNGESVRVNARHDFSGHSQWNPAHGIAKALMMGVKDHLAVAGHKHVSGYNIIKDADTGLACHALRIASYKVHDRYAKEKGFPDHAFGPAAVTVINPALPNTHPDLVKVFWDPEEGADFLKYARKRAGC
jgi:hypothetical protein